MIVTAIAAMAKKNRVIGRDGTLPWVLAEDMQFFKKTTNGHIIIMGRKTFESLGAPLPNRYHIIVSRNSSLKVEGAKVVSSIDQALAEASHQIQINPAWGEEVFVIGGGEIYELFLSRTDRIYLTEIDLQVQGTACFPEFSPADFREVKRVARPGPPTFEFVTYENPDFLKMRK
jgi:dihydrofolate reductase